MRLQSRRRRNDDEESQEAQPQANGVIPAMPVLQLRPEFQMQHMRGTAIELSNRQNTGWTQRKAAAELLDITYPTGDVRRALDAVSAATASKPIVMMGQRGSGKSH